MRHPTDLHSGTVAWPKVKILVFSRDEAFRFLVRSTFRKLRVKDVVSTAEPDDAEQLVGYGADIALVDFDGDGHAALGFISRVKAAPGNPNPNMPILAAVKAADRTVVAPALNMGIEGVVPKPVSGHELTIRVAETLLHPSRAAPPPPPAAAMRQPAQAAKPTSRPEPPPPPPAAMRQPAQAAKPTSRSEPPPMPAAPHAARPAAASAPKAAVRTAASAVETPSPPPRAEPARPSAPAAAAGRPSGGKLPDPQPPYPPASSPSGIETLAAAAPPQYRLEHGDDDAATRRKAAKARADWQIELAQAGHLARTGSDVARLDVTAIVAAHLAWLQTQGGQGTRASFQGMDLAGADLAGTVLANATFRDADLSDASLAGSRLDGADFRHARLGAADLSWANLGVAQLRHAKCALANLSGAVLRGADLSGADLRGARLDGADLTGATLISTDLRGTDLSKVDNMAQTQAYKAVCDMKTKLPPGVMRPARDDA